MTTAYDDLERPPLHADVLRRVLVRPGGRWRKVEVITETSSTNADVAERARAGEPEGLVLVAESQVSGRGRLGRHWTAPPRSGLTVSVLLRPPVPVAAWSWLPLLTGVAVAEAVSRSTELPTTVKWPNDILVGDRKLAGVLLERVDSPAGPAAVVGIGLNVTLRADERPVASATSLLLEGVPAPDRTVVLREILRVLDRLYAAWLEAAGDTTSGLADSYNRRCSTIGRQVRVEVPSGGPVEGRAVRIDRGGRLVVATTRGEVAVGAGDVVHVR
jgi:BirA family transcriptional regulator, biotin operon repressor / biotin---[acetyl-CoA-carboxylase] ligase